MKHVLVGIKLNCTVLTRKILRLQGHLGRDHVPARCMGQEEEEPGPWPGPPIPMLNKPHSTAGKVPSFLPQHLGVSPHAHPPAPALGTGSGRALQGDALFLLRLTASRPFCPGSAKRTNPLPTPALGDPPQTKRDQKRALINLDPAQQNPHWVHSTQIPLKSNFICSLQFYVVTELEFRKTSLMCYFRGSQR